MADGVEWSGPYLLGPKAHTYEGIDLHILELSAWATISKYLWYQYRACNVIMEIVARMLWPGWAGVTDRVADTSKGKTVSLSFMTLLRF